MANQLNRQLNKLQNEIKPDSAWQARSRDILLMQIKQGAAEKDAHWFTFIETVWVQRFLFQATRPMALAVLVLLAVFGGSTMSLRAANQTKPGDPLYIAKIISEKTQFALTFDNTKKAKLNLTFATNRATELKEMEKSSPEKAGHEEQVKELTSQIKAEMAEAQSRIAKIVPVQPVRTVEVEKTAEKEAEKVVTPAKPAEEVKIAPAAIQKASEGIDYYDPRQAALEQAKNYIDNKDYVAAATQLQSLNEAIEEPEKLEIQKATSTDVKSEQLEKSTSTVIEIE